MNATEATPHGGMHRRRARRAAARRARLGRIAGLAGCWLAVAVQAQTAAPTAQAVAPLGQPARDAMLYLELVVNERPSGQIVAVRQRGGGYAIRAGDLARVSIHTTAPADQWLDLGQLDGVTMEYESTLQRLKLTVPPGWLPHQSLGASAARARVPVEVGFGALFNYDVYAASPTQGRNRASAWLEQRGFDRWGALVNTGVLRADGSATGERYLRYDTAWRYSDETRMRSYVAGDLITGALPWSNAVRLGGVSVARDFSVRPDLVTYPLPRFSGQAAVPTTVDLFINGSRAASEPAEPGPFTMDNVPFINGAGEATLVTTDALGRRVETIVPFYVANTLLRRGWSSYALDAGFVRRDYGMRSFRYGRFAASGVLRYGLTDGLTLDAHAEGGAHLALGGAGLSLGLGPFGVVNAAAAHSRVDGAQGWQYAFGYSYTSQRGSLALQRLQRTAGYGDLSVYGQRGPGHRFGMPRASTQATGALSLGRAGGTLGAGYVEVRGADGGRFRVVNLSYSRPLLRVATLYAALNRTLGEGGVAAQLGLVVPLGGRGVATAGAARDPGGRLSERVQYSRGVPSDGGFGWNLGYAAGGERDRLADLTWRGRALQLQGGVFSNGAGRQFTRWGDAQGAFVLMDGALLAANRVDDAFVVVSTDGERDVPVRYENQLVGVTGRSGHLLVPWAPSYYAAKYEIDPLELPADVRASTVEQRVAVRERSGALVRFPLRRVVAARIALVDADGRPLPAGLRVTHLDSGATALVGWGGETYFEDLAASNRLRVHWPDGRACEVEFGFAPRAADARRVGPLRCDASR
jgi:outer membrane usher protein